MTVVWTQTRTRKVRTVAYTVTNTAGFLASAFQKFPTRGLCDRQRRPLGQFSLSFSFIHPQCSGLGICWMHKSIWAQTCQHWYATHFDMFKKSTSGRQNSIIRPMLPGKQFKLCLVYSKCCCCSVIHDVNNFLYDVHVCVFNRVWYPTQADKKRPLHLETIPTSAKLTSSLSHEMPTECHIHRMQGRMEKQLHRGLTHLKCLVQKAIESLYSFQTLSIICPHPIFRMLQFLIPLQVSTTCT